MRAHTVFNRLVSLAFVTSIGLIGLVGLATADPASEELKKVDISKLQKDMVVLHDGKGHYLIAMPTTDHYSEAFYGDGKTFYKQRSFGGSLDTSSKSSNARFWSPRTGHRASLIQRKGAWRMECGKRKTELQVLPAGKAKKLIARAEFFEPMWRHSAYKLARDENGNYYFVDRLRDEHGGKGFRMWVGPVGNMKRMKMTNIVSDSEGDIFATKTGQLRFITSTSKKTSLWVAGKDRMQLLNVPVIRNIELIYAELGVYLGDLGTPCDHL